MKIYNPPVSPFKKGGVILPPFGKGRLRRIFICSVFMLVTLLVTGGTPALSSEKEGRKTEMKKLLPQEVGNYRSEGKDQYYDRQAAFRYMDGAAELYRSYGFKLLLVRHYLKAGDPPILVELFDMGLPEDAFGIFSYETGGEEVGVGQGSDYGGGLLRFWKGKYFVNVYAERETPLTRKEVLEIGKAVANSIKPKSQKPKLINLLPREYLLERNIRYFHHPHSLNYHYFVSHQNILFLGEKTNVALGSYLFPQAKGKTFLLLIQYPTQKLAEAAFQSFVKVYMPESPPARVVQTENGKWTGGKLHQKYVIVVFDATDKEKAEELIQATKKKLEAEGAR